MTRGEVENMTGSGHTSKRRGRWWLLMLGALLLPPALLLVSAALTPYFLLNTSLGRTVLRGAASSTDDAHLSLEGSRLTLSPTIGLTLEGLKLVRPYEPQAPALSMARMALLDVSIASQLPGSPLVCQEALFEGFDIEVNQRWMQLNQSSDSPPPELPDYFPKKIIARTVSVSDTNYMVHQYKNGRPTFMRLTGITTTLKNFEWDLKTSHIQGAGPFSAEKLELNGLVFDHMEVPGFRADGTDLYFPDGRLTGMGGTVEISGILKIVRGVPNPSFDLNIKGIDLAPLILSNPDAPQTAATPTGKVYLKGRTIASPSKVIGEAPEPVIEGDLRLEAFALPMVNKSKLASRVIERIPGYVPGDVPRLVLGTLEGKIRVAHGKLRLKRLHVKLGERYVLIDGVITQATGGLDLKLWVEKTGEAEAALSAPASNPEELTEVSDTNKNGLSQPSSAAQIPPTGRPAQAAERESISAQARSGADDELAPLEVSGDQVSGDKAGDTDAENLTSTPRVEAADEPTWKRRFRDRKQRRRAKAEQIKEQVDAKAAEVKANREDRKEARKTDIEEKFGDEIAAVEARREKRQETRSAKKEEALEALERTKLKVKGRREARVEKVKSFVEGHRKQFRSDLENRLGKPMLCITGTTQAPQIDLCPTERGRKGAR